MKKILIILLTVLGVFLFFNQAKANTNNVIIYSLYPNPPGADTNEFIEIKNISSSTIDLTSWKLLDKTKEYTLNGQLEGNKIMRIDKVSSSITLNNSGGEEVELVDDNGSVVDSVAYASAPENKVYLKINGGYKWVDYSTNTTSVFTTSTIKNKASKYQTLTIQNARSTKKDTMVEVKGIITVLPDVFSSQYVYISDTNSGIQIYSYKKEFNEVELGDYVKVQGTISSAYGIPRLKIKEEKDIQVIGKSSTEPIIKKQISQLNEKSYGSLILVSGTITELKSTYMYIDDGNGEVKVYFKKGASISKKDFNLKDKIEVVGILENYKDSYYILPRSIEDTLVVKEGVIEKEENKINAPLVLKTDSSAKSNEKIFYITILVLLLIIIISIIFYRTKKIKPISI